MIIALVVVAVVVLSHLYRARVDKTAWAAFPDISKPSSIASPWTLPTPENKAQVNVFVPRITSCPFHLPMTVPGKGRSKICTYDPDADREISLHIRNSGTPYSEGDIRVVLNLMRQDTAQNRRSSGESISLVDAGANIGLFTLSAALNGYKVLAIDAMNSSLQLLATSVRLANVSSQVVMMHNAISDTHKNVTVQVRWPNNIGASWVLHNTSTGVATNTQQVKAQAVVKAICLDDLVPYVPTHRVFLKMDIEGSEWRALRCADRFFAEVEIPYIHMEWLHYSLYQPKNGETIISYLTQRGYRPYNPNNRATPLPVSLSKGWPGNVLWLKKNA